MEDLYFKMTGKAFEEGYRLDKTVAGLNGLQHLMDGVYKGITNKGRLSKQDREVYKVVVSEVKHGSLIVDLGAFYSGMQHVLPFVYSTDPEHLWEYTKSAISFLCEIYRKSHEGKSIVIEQGDECVSVVIQGDSNETHIYNAPVFQIGTQIISGLRELDDSLDDDEVSGIYLGANYEKNSALNLSSTEKGIFHAPVTLDKDPKIIRCDIFDFNKYDKIGKLMVQKDQSIPEGRYKFKVIGRQGIEDFILSMAETQVEINCIVEYEHDPLLQTKIGTVLIVDIAA